MRFLSLFRRSFFQQNTAIWLVFPALLGLGLLTYLPTLGSLWLSFHSWNLLNTPGWVGSDNYQRLLEDPTFWNSLLITGAYVLACTSLELLVSLGLAFLVAGKGAGMAWVRAGLFLPYVTPLVSMSLVWEALFDPGTGPVMAVLQQAGWVSGSLLHQPETAFGVLVALRVWKNVGYAMLLFLAGLQTIPAEVMESAQLDGASPWQAIWRIRLPLLRPTMFFVATMTVIQVFQMFDAVYLLTQGGPNHSTEFLVYRLFRQAFGFFRIGEAAALGFLVFVLLAGLTALQWMLGRNHDLNASAPAVDTNCNQGRGLKRR